MRRRALEGLPVGLLYAADHLVNELLMIGQAGKSCRVRGERESCKGLFG